MPDDADSTCPPGLEAGLMEAMRICKGEGEAARQGGRFVGVNPDEPDVDCDASLREGLDEETLASNRGARQWVMCRVFNETPDGEPALLDKHDDNLAAAMEEAWNTVDAARENMGME